MTSGAASPATNAMSLLSWLEIAQIRWRLVLVGRHQLAVGAAKIVFFLDADMRVGFRANLREPHRTGIWIAGGLLDLDVGPRQRMIEHGDLVIKGVGVGLVEVDPLLDDGLIIPVERDARDIVAALVLEETGLAIEHIALAVAR